MLWANFKPKRTAAASRGFLATARLSCFNIELFVFKEVAKLWLASNKRANPNKQLWQHRVCHEHTCSTLTSQSK